MARYQIHESFIPHVLFIDFSHRRAGRSYWECALDCGDYEVFDEDLTTPDFLSEDQAAARALAFFTLGPGDTDDEYFAQYSHGQMVWCEVHASDVALALIDEDGNERDDLSAYRIEAQ